MNVYPTKLARTAADRLRIDWSDGAAREYTARELRNVCPCATCREKRNAPPAAPNLLTILKPEETRPMTILGMQAVGNYAYSLEFSDGHNTGIYTLDFLRTLGEEVPVG